MINMINMKMITPYSVYQSVYCAVKSKDVAIPINTLMPPKTGTGWR